MVNRQCPYPRGKGMGGSTILSSLMYQRGNRWDYDTWAALGNPGWSYRDVLPYFIKSENSQVKGDPGYHGKSGFLNVEYTRPPSQLYGAFVEANAISGKYRSRLN